MHKTPIQLRIEEKFFTKKHVAEAVGVSLATLNSWLDKNKILLSVNNKFSINQVEKIIAALNYSPIIKFCSKKDEKKWTELVNCFFVLEGDGIFLFSPSANMDKSMADIIQKDGIWNAQGLNNHEHMRDYVKNPVLQMILAKKIINIWIEKASKLVLKKKVVIYWNGKIDSTICIYLLNDINDDKYLEMFDKQLGIEKCSIVNL